jgi:hypothetical protein
MDSTARRINIAGSGAGTRFEPRTPHEGGCTSGSVSVFGLMP